MFSLLIYVVADLAYLLIKFSIKVKV